MSLVAKIGVVCGLALVGAAVPEAASAVVLYDQTGSVGAGIGTESMTYTKPNDVTAADDFTVLAGESWTIAEVDVIGREGDPTNLKTDVYIYADAGGIPGGILFEQDDIVASNGPSFNSSLTGAPALGPGKYWVSVTAAAFWHWKNSTALAGSPAVWQNPSGEYAPTLGKGCGAWKARTTCYPTSVGEPDQAFRLIGAETPTVLPGSTKPSNAFSFGALKLNKKKGLGTLTVNVPGAGTLSLSGTGLKSATASALAAGAVNLTLKATGKAKKKLKKKGKAKATATVVFTPTGGDPATQAKAVTLKKKKKKPPQQ